MTTRLYAVFASPPPVRSGGDPCEEDQGLTLTLVCWRKCAAVLAGCERVTLTGVQAGLVPLERGESVSSENGDSTGSELFVVRNIMGLSALCCEEHHGV